MKKRYISAGLIIAVCIVGGVIVSRNDATTKVEENKIGHSYQNENSIENHIEKNTIEEKSYVTHDDEDTVTYLTEDDFSYMTNSDIEKNTKSHHTYTPSPEE